MISIENEDLSRLTRGSQDGASYFPKNLILGRSLLPIVLGLELFIHGSIEGVGSDIKSVSFYVMSSTDGKNGIGNYWTSVADWPEYTPTPLYFHADGTLSYDRELLPISWTSYEYDPANAVPTEGGNNLMIACGPTDQSPTENRTDVLVYTMPVLEEPLAVTGPLEATIYVETEAKDTDFVVKITDVYPDGRSILLQDGIQRLRWRAGPEAATPSLAVPVRWHAALNSPVLDIFFLFCVRKWVTHTKCLSPGRGVRAQRVTVEYFVRVPSGP